MIRRLVLFALFASTAWAQPTTSGPGLMIQNGGVNQGRAGFFNCSTGTVCSCSGLVCTITASGGGGSGTNGLTPVPSLTVVTGASALFLGAGTGVDPTEVNTQLRVPQAETLQKLSCVTSAALGAGNNITVAGRSGTCGAAGTDSGTFVCTLTGGVGVSTCDTSANTLGLSSGACWTLHVTFTNTPASPTFLNCLVERST